MKIRTFIAIPLDQDIKEKIALFQEDLKKEILKGIKWVDSESLHLTLKFLGDIEESQISSVYQAMKNFLTDQNVFSFKIAHLGTFPNIQNPSVIWTGIENSRDILQSLSAGLNKEMQKLGIPPEEKDFSPHITLGRVKRGAAIEGNYQEAILKHKDIFLGEQQVKSIILFKSDLQPKGPIYTALEKVELKN